MAPTLKAAKHAEQVVDETVERWDSYVTELGRADGEYVGGGTRALGLGGAPQEGATWSLMNGVHPMTGERFHTPYWTKVNPVAEQGQKKRARVPAYASVIAAPKSASVLLATGYRDAVLEAHRVAVGEAVRFIESQWLVRDRSGSHKSLGVVGTAYEHHTSRVRVPEPHLHTHVSFMNFAQRASDGKWLSVDYAQFLRVQKSAGIVYQATLRRELAMRIPGIEFDLHEDGTADIAQIPEEVRERFSTRQSEVLKRERELARAGMLPGLKRKDIAGFETRSAKEVIDPKEWLQQQRDALSWLGVTDESIAAWAGQERTHVAASWELRREELADRLFDATGLTEKSNTFNRWDVMEQVGMAHYTDMGSFEQLLARTDELLADPRVIAVGEQGRYTVSEIVELEESVLETQRRVLPRASARSGRRRILSGLMSQAELRQGWRFNAGQRVMIEGIATSGNRVEVVEALAGTGKTASLGMLAEVLEADGVHVIGAAPTGRARLELMQSAGITDSHTLASLKLRRENGEQIFDNQVRFVLAVDEAGFSATREFAGVFQDAIAAGGRIVLIGDSGQLGSVGAGGLFAAISREREAKGQKVYRLTAVQRQQTVDRKVDEFEVRALEALHSKSPGEWVELREERGQLHIHTGPDAGVRGIEQAAELYLQTLEQTDAKDIYLLAADNAVRGAINDAVRAQLVERGEIIEAGVIGGRRFAEGERIVLRANDNDKKLANGMRATILSVDGENGTLTVVIDGEHGGVVELDHAYVTGVTESGQQRVQGGYANTIHTSQGGTVNVTIVVGAAQSLDNERGYVAASRARHATHVITWDGSAPEYFAEHEPSPEQQAQEVRDQLLDALERTGVEPAASVQIAEAGEQLQLDLQTDSIEQQTSLPRVGIEPVREQETLLDELEALDTDGQRLDAKASPDLCGAAQDVVSEEQQNAHVEQSHSVVEQPLAQDEPERVIGVPAADRNVTRSAEHQRASTNYYQAVAAAGAEKHRELEGLREQLAAAGQRRAVLGEQFDAATKQAAAVGAYANRLERTFPTGPYTSSASDQLTYYGLAVEELAGATKRKDIKRLSQQVSTVRAELPEGARELLDQQNRRGIDDREAMRRYQESRSARDQTHQRCKELWNQAVYHDKMTIDYRPGARLAAGTGLGQIRALEARIRSAEEAIETLSDPARAISERLSQTLEVNRFYQRGPASVIEANSWAAAWGHNLRLHQSECTVTAEIPELPGWRHPLNEQQMLTLTGVMAQAQESGRQLGNLDLAPREAERRYERGRGTGLGIGD